MAWDIVAIILDMPLFELQKPVISREANIVAVDAVREVAEEWQEGRDTCLIKSKPLDGICQCILYDITNSLSPICSHVDTLGECLVSCPSRVAKSPGVLRYCLKAP